MMVKLKLFILVFSISSFSMSGEITEKIKYVQVNVESGLPNAAAIKFESAPVNRPDCATDDRMAVDLSTEAGKGVLSVAIAAKAAGREIHARGTGSCMNALEKIAYIRFQ